MKAHSERVSGKNFRSFAGKPLFQWILDSLLAVKSIERIVINTDAREILASHGLVDTDRILIRDRRAEICGDFVSMNLIIEDDITNVPAATYLMTHTTNPFVSSGTLHAALLAFRNAVDTGAGDSLFSVNRFQSRFYRADGTPINHDPNNLIRTQDLEPWFEENSNLYIFSKESFHKTRARIGLAPVLFETPPEESYDIDDQADWKLAERLALTTNC